jgi:protein-S-isoprenylcysteine O-methyltransferase Ste14
VELLGFVVASVAACAYVHCAWLLVLRGRGTPLAFAPPREFVAMGAYRYTRNPMALSVVAGIAGLSVALDSLAGLGFAGLLSALLHLYITRREEPELRRRFGDTYVSYCKQVPRWLPRVRGRGRASV